MPKKGGKKKKVQGLPNKFWTMMPSPGTFDWCVLSYCTVHVKVLIKIRMVSGFDRRHNMPHQCTCLSTFISNIHAISKCHFGLLTGSKAMLTRSTWQKFLSTGPHPVYRVKPYRYKTQSCQQAELSCCQDNSPVHMAYHVNREIPCQHDITMSTGKYHVNRGVPC